MIKAIHTTLPLPSKINQIDGLQILRAVAVFLVAWLHCGQWMYPAAGQEALPTLGVFGIDIFFVISGFILSTVVLRIRKAPGAGTMWEFLKRRLIRIFPIYWFFCLLQIARLLHSHQFFRQNYFAAFFLLPGFRHIKIDLLVDFSWTLTFEMFFYYTLALTLLVTVRRAVPATIAVFCGAVILGSFIGIGRPIVTLVCNPLVLEFVLGCLLALAYRRFGRHRRLGIILLILGFVAAAWLQRSNFAAIASGPEMISSGNGVMLRVMTWGFAAAMVVGGMVFWSPAITSSLGKFAVVLGNASYSTYLCSAMVMEFSQRLLVKLGGDVVPHSVGKLAVYQIASTTAILVAGWVCYQFVEWPMLRWLQARLLEKAP